MLLNELSQVDYSLGDPWGMRTKTTPTQCASLSKRKCLNIMPKKRGAACMENDDMAVVMPELWLG